MNATSLKHGRSRNAVSSRPCRSGRQGSTVVRAYVEERQKPDVKHHAPQQQAHAFKNQLEALKSMSVVVADSGEIDLVKKYHPVDCTTNPRCLGLGPGPGSKPGFM